MLIKRLLTLAITCALPWTVSSCLEDIDLDTGERILYVYCILGQGPEQELELSYYAPNGGTISPVGEGVVISLYDDGAPVGEFTRVSETKWILGFSPEGGHTYRLEVNVPGEEQLTAETTFPPASTLQRVWYATDVELSDGSVGTGYYWLYELNADEDQILWCFFENNQKDGKKAFSDYVVTDHPGVDLRGETGYPWDCYSEAWSDFYANLWGLEFHFSGGGFFRGADVITAPFLHERVVRILHPGGFVRSEERITKYRLDNNVPIPLEEGYASGFGLVGVNKKGGMGADLVVCSVSSEYDAFLTDYYFFRSDTDDFTDTVYRRNHYSNIRNGTGIFGASIEYRRPNMDLTHSDPRFMGY